MIVDVLFIWTVYDHPADFPDHFVARKFALDKATDDFILADTLENLRAEIQKRELYTLFKINRACNDDPVIIESWI
jgi:hypothetical protein